MKSNATVQVVKPSTARILAEPKVADEGVVRMGTMSPTFPAVRTAPANITDTTRVRMGTMSPTFPTVRDR